METIILFIGSTGTYSGNAVSINQSIDIWSQINECIWG